MPVGIEKIVVISKGKEQSWKRFWLAPEHALQLKVIYYPETPEALKGYAKWIIKPKTGTLYSSRDQEGLIGDDRTISIKAKFCGPKEYVVEAFLDQPLNKYPTQLTFYGKAPQKIVSTKWSKTNGGGDIRQSPIKYGDNVWLNMQTEGLNGAKLDIDVYNRQWGEDEKAASFKGVDCLSGEINLEIKNTYTWRAHTGMNTDNDGEEFYVKVSLSGKSTRILDDKKQDIHARYLKILDEITTREVKEHKSAKPVMVGENEVNVERYELCRFTKIDVTDDKDKIILFDEGKILIDTKTKSEFQLSETIHFDLDKFNIRSDAKPVLDGISKLLLDNPYVPAEIGAHCDIRADDKYNDELSNKRAIAAQEYLVSKGVVRDKINAKGYGKRRLLIKGTDLSEEEHQLNRRVTIKFEIFGDNAESIVFETIAPDEDLKKEITVNASTYETDKCLRKGTSEEHDKQVKVLELTPKGENGTFEYDGAKPVKHKVYSNLSTIFTFPIQYIWPINNTTNQFKYHINSCRYYSNNEKATVVVKAYTDIKWKLNFFVNLTNELAVAWQNFSPAEHKEMQKKAGKIGAEKRWKQKDASFGFELVAQWNKLSKDSFKEKESFKVKYETKFKKLYDLFSSIGNMSKGVTNKTKGTVRNIGFKNVPVSFAILPPNVNLDGEWYLERAKVKGQAISQIGTKVVIDFNAKPLIGLEITIDLIGAAVGVVAGAISGGTAAPGAMKLYNTIKDALNKGVDLGNDDLGIKANMDIYVDLVISNKISTGLGFSFNTVGDPNPEGKLELANKLSVELKAGVLIKGELSLIVVSVKGYFKAEASGKASVTFGHAVKYDKDGLYYQPQLGFDGLNAEYTVIASAGLSTKKIATGLEVDKNKEYKIAEGKYENIVKPFDVIKSLEELTGFDSKIPLIKN